MCVCVIYRDGRWARVHVPRVNPMGRGVGPLGPGGCLERQYPRGGAGRRGGPGRWAQVEMSGRPRRELTRGMCVCVYIYIYIYPVNASTNTGGDLYTNIGEEPCANRYRRGGALHSSEPALFSCVRRVLRAWSQRPEFSTPRVPASVWLRDGRVYVCAAGIVVWCGTWLWGASYIIYICIYI